MTSAFHTIGSLTFTPGGGTYTSPQYVVMSCAVTQRTTPTVYYTTDGTTPSFSSHSVVSGGSVTISSITTLQGFC